jgi:GT2 family glycosyltransferase
MPLASSIQRSITAVVVLYRRTPAESSSLSSLVQILNANSWIAGHFSLLIYDNSPHPQGQEILANFPIHFVHDPANGGLAQAYNYALAHAGRENHEWLMLLDQDTSVTNEYLTEAVTCANALQGQEDVASIVPKLLVNGEIYSPDAHFIDVLRHQFSKKRYVIDQQLVGIENRRLMAYNSGALLRVSALRAIGGFPSEFWLDYLDHAVFHALFARGYRMYVMRSMLEHAASQADVREVPLWRLRNLLSAQTLFVKRVGNYADQLLYRISLLRYSRVLWISYKDRRAWKEAAVQALRLRIPKTLPYIDH